VKRSARRRHGAKSPLAGPRLAPSLETTARGRPCGDAGALARLAPGLKRWNGTQNGCTASGAVVRSWRIAGKRSYAGRPEERLKHAMDGGGAAIVARPCDPDSWRCAEETPSAQRLKPSLGAQS